MTRQRRKPLAPRSAAAYKALLERAFGPPPYTRDVEDLGQWTLATLKLLHAATLKYAPDRIDDVPQGEYEVARVIVPPTEDELTAIELAAEALPPAQRAMALLPLGLGLRASEVLNLSRKNVQRAAGGEELLALRKGGREQLLPADGVRNLLADLLTQKWDVSWQILTDVGERAAYRALYRLIKRVGLQAKVKGMRPHKLRHGFATRLMRAGASLPQIQVLMDHADPAMTMRYVHPENKDVVKFLQKMKRGKREE